VTFLSSCDARRKTDWEAISWLDYVGGERFGDDYRRSVAALPQFTQASKAEDTSAEYMAHFLEQMIYGNMGRGVNGPTVRVLDGPTQEVWIDPWVAELDRLGVKLRLHHELRGLDARGGRIVAAGIRTPKGRRRITADHFVMALPVERARRFWTDEIHALDPSLREMDGLGVDWMNGISFFLTERRDLQDGIFMCCDSPWAVSAIPQAQFWEEDFAATWGDGRAVDKLSAAIADWRTPGDFVRKRADECTPEEVVEETWEQLKAHVNEPGRAPLLEDSMLHSYEIDPGMRLRDGRLVSGDPLVLPTKGTQRFRPSPVTKVPNLMLCGDYLSKEWIITTMESACESGRQAANGVLAAAGSRETPATVFRTYRPPEWEPLKAIDAQRHTAGERHVLDA
jgi:uncharacterized protein with NAD-binding domain and iron-sulfur cluster